MAIPLTLAANKTAGRRRCGVSASSLGLCSWRRPHSAIRRRRRRDWSETGAALSFADPGSGLAVAAGRLGLLIRGGNQPGDRVEAEIGYGLPAFGMVGVLTPDAGASLTDAGTHSPAGVVAAEEARPTVDLRSAD